MYILVCLYMKQMGNNWAGTRPRTLVSAYERREDAVAAGEDFKKSDAAATLGGHSPSYTVTRSDIAKPACSCGAEYCTPPCAHLWHGLNYGEDGHARRQNCVLCNLVVDAK